MSLLSEEDLNDFISPALACTKPTEIKRTKVKSNVNALGEYEVGVDDGEDEVLEKVTITLSDCLACSGCITSSEEIMLQQQSHGVFLEAMSKRDITTKLAISISPQCRLSMATYYGMDISDFDKCFANFFQKRFDAKYVVGTQLGRNVSIQQVVKKLTDWKKSKEYEVDSRPRLSAADPGFVIYTEKTKPDLVPLLLNVKSPQQITGALLHETFDKNHKTETQPDTKLYVLGVMACFDKKLEASRPDSAGEVDCVITPKEFVAMLSELNEIFEQYKSPSDDILSEMCPEGWDPELHWCINHGSSSGGFAYQYIVSRQRTLSSELIKDSKIMKLLGKNNNICEHRLINVKTGETIASASELSGFRNIQNMVRHLSRGGPKGTSSFPKRRVQSLRKRQSSTNTTSTTTSGTTTGRLGTLVAQPYSSEFIEVNAAPGGCLNGSGLLNGEQSTVRKRQFTQQLEERFHSSFTMVDPLDITQWNTSEILDSDRVYEYTFHAAEPQDKQKDIVTVGNTW
ncbi:similar to Saccharomyces cerevisiae YNL240C NAR1 Component of the cytosolic iron-sulfur (FeS) protein assembly machinery [Maudiozyma barnettii]|uniref:Cytosolic Fe-S cluster assembly factor NAR1 n=1 Tax=Maudiozyma barnettii TaxID=61262 RepID=A0A8H2ZGN0_9SACH|nr:iron-sulfur cluster assembly protein NAR1 [Kazachstania barnettii]CAB4253838.1 similar to Saccharomyces cerevisiae YNL240C NAR1 Component of the cytosolic iron-sulfur (FeS) protein assembly machinery [Kazachstania barnettii]CAD1781588.1 similar to Saccharomyces cerevisiae YNL240C NAR1 Component of the cytosolic iron-sulfur (FeS) protein assembly machinery [Kazachstania barnettii]